MIEWPAEVEVPEGGLQTLSELVHFTQFRSGNNSTWLFSGVTFFYLFFTISHDMQANNTSPIYSLLSKRNIDDATWPRQVAPSKQPCY